MTTVAARPADRNGCIGPRPPHTGFDLLGSGQGDATGALGPVSSQSAAACRSRHGPAPGAMRVLLDGQPRQGLIAADGSSGRG